MANLYVSLPVPAGDGAGAWVDVSGMAPGKTISVDSGAFTGALFIESSNDGRVSACPVDVRAFQGGIQGGASAPVEIVATLQFMRVRRSGTFAPAGAPTVKVAGETANPANVFGAMAVPAGDGAGAGIDLTAGGPVNTFNVVGPFSGQVFVDISTDAGATWSPRFLTGVPGQVTAGSAVGTNVLGVLAQARVRRVGSLPGGAPVVSVGSGGEAGAGGGSPIFDWLDLMRATFQRRTGLLPQNICRVFSEHLSPKWFGVTQDGFFATAPGTNAYQNAPPTSAGVVVSTSGAEAGGSVGWQCDGITGYDVIPNVRQSRYMLAFLKAVAAAPANGANVSMGLFCGGGGGVYQALGWIDAAANWQYVSGTPLPDSSVDLGVPIETSGNVYQTGYVANFDLLNLVVNPNFGQLGDAGDHVAAPLVSLPNSSGRPRYFNNAAAQVVNMDAICILVEGGGS